jgi:hypothetical protein
MYFLIINSTIHNKSLIHNKIERVQKNDMTTVHENTNKNTNKNNIKVLSSCLFMLIPLLLL